MGIKAILAIDEDYGIGKNGKMAWHIPEDFKHFKNYTNSSICVMGSTTYEDIVSHTKSKEGPLLPNRICIVLTSRVLEYRNQCKFNHVTFIDDRCNFLKNLLYFATLPTEEGSERSICIIGGKSVYSDFFNSDVITEVSISRISGTYDCDVNIKNELDKWLEPFEITEAESISDKCKVEIYRRKIQ